LLEALNVGAVDVSADVADTVPVFALAAGAQLTYIAQESPSPSAQAIVVKADSPIKTIADLKGKRIGFAKAAGAHYLLLAALDQAGLSLKDVQPAYLAPADGRAAFEKGAIDAWVIWDPFLAAVQRQTQARILADGRNLADYQRYYLASTPFAKARPDVVKAIVDALKETGKWVKQSPRDAANLLSPVWGLDAQPSNRPTAAAAMKSVPSCNSIWPSSRKLPTLSSPKVCCRRKSTPLPYRSSDSLHNRKQHHGKSAQAGRTVADTEH
jgi:sulfonate transport system substrate-binding protein